MTRPRVMMNSAASLDGKLAPAPGLRTPGFLPSRGPEDPTRMRALRARADAIVIGAGNLRFDNPDLALLADEHARRRHDGTSEPLRVVVTGRGADIDPSMRIFDRSLGGEPIVAHGAAMGASARARLARCATLVELGDEGVDVAALLGWLARERGVQTVLSEGGGALNASFFAARAVDEIYLTLTPRILGGAGAPTMVDGKGFADDALPDVTLASVERVGDELFLKYLIAWKAEETAPPDGPEPGTSAPDVLPSSSAG